MWTDAARRAALLARKAHVKNHNLHESQHVGGPNVSQTPHPLEGRHRFSSKSEAIAQAKSARAAGHEAKVFKAEQYIQQTTIGSFGGPRAAVQPARKVRHYEVHISAKR